MASRIPAIALIAAFSILPIGGAAAAPPTGHPEVSHATAHDTSPAVRDMPALPPAEAPKGPTTRFTRIPPSRIPRGPVTPDPVRQSTPGPLVAPSTSSNFEGRHRCGRRTPGRIPATAC